MRDCTTCPDECEQLGTKKMPSRTAMRKGHIEKYPFKVYHIVKPKGNKTMIELKITVDKAVELEQEVKDLYQSIVGTSIKDAPVVENKPVKQEEPKKAAKPVETKQVESEIKETKNETSSFEELGEEVPSLEDTRAAVKAVVKTSDDKTAFKAFLNEIGAESVTKANDAQRIQIVKWAKNRG